MIAALLRIRAILVKELRQLRRDRLTFAMIVGIPVLQMLLFGYAINTDVRHLRAGVADEAQTELSRRLIADAAATQVVDIVALVSNADELLALLRRGEIAVGIAIPADLGRRLQTPTAGPDRPPERAAVQLLVDGSDPTIAAAAAKLAELPLRHATAPTPPTAAPVFAVHTLYNPERRSAVNAVPGLIGVILTITMVLFTAVAIVREAERGNLELLINTPVSPLELMLGKLLPYVGIGLVQVTLILALGVLLFEVPVHGSLWQVYGVALLFIAANLALGLAISTAARTQFQAMQLTFFLLLPSILLSGFVFPFDGMPAAAQCIGEALPLTHFVRLVRGLMLREADVSELPGELAWLAIFTLVMLAAAVARFRRTLD